MLILKPKYSQDINNSPYLHNYVRYEASLKCKSYKNIHNKAETFLPNFNSLKLKQGQKENL